MKYGKQFILMLLAVTAVLFSGCGQAQKDAQAWFGESKSLAENMKSCTYSFESRLSFTANGTPHLFCSSGTLVYHKEPFALKAEQTSENDGLNAKSETYTILENGDLKFYCNADGDWHKTDVTGLDTAPSAQINMVDLLNKAEGYEDLGRTTTDSINAQKVRLLFQKDVLQSTIETIVTATGMADGSQTIIPTLLDSAPPVYGDCYIDTETRRPVRLELDFAETVNEIFSKIDGGTVDIHVSECRLTENLSDIDGAPAVALPSDAATASPVQALG